MKLNNQTYFYAAGGNTIQVVLSVQVVFVIITAIIAVIIVIIYIVNHH